MVNILREIPEDVLVIIWKNLFQETLNELKYNGMQHLKRCGICKKHY